MLFRESFITDAGSRLLARATAQEGAVIWTAAATSSLNSDSMTDAQMNALDTATFGTKTSSGAVTNAIVNDEQSSVSIHCELTNEDYDGLARTFGVWAKIDGDAQDVLAVVARCGTGVTPTTINPASEGVVRAFVDFTLTITDSQAQAVQVTEGYYATSTALQQERAAREALAARVVTKHSASDATLGDNQKIRGRKEILSYPLYIGDTEIPESSQIGYLTGPPMMVMRNGIYKAEIGHHKDLYSDQLVHGYLRFWEQGLESFLSEIEVTRDSDDNTYLASSHHIKHDGTKYAGLDEKIHTTTNLGSVVPRYGETKIYALDGTQAEGYLKFVGSASSGVSASIQCNDLSVSATTTTISGSFNVSGGTTLSGATITGETEIKSGNGTPHHGLSVTTSNARLYGNNGAGHLASVRVTSSSISFSVYDIASGNIKYSKVDDSFALYPDDASAGFVQTLGTSTKMWHAVYADNLIGLAPTRNNTSIAVPVGGIVLAKPSGGSDWGTASPYRAGDAVTLGSMAAVSVSLDSNTAGSSCYIQEGKYRFVSNGSKEDGVGGYVSVAALLMRVE